MGLIRTIDRKLTAEIADGAVTDAKVAADAAIAATKLAAGAVKATIIAGGAAGDHTITGIAVGDSLVAVLHMDFTDASETGADITIEFSISAANTLNNSGGTNTTGGYLMVVWEDRT